MRGMIRMQQRKPIDDNYNLVENGRGEESKGRGRFEGHFGGKLLTSLFLAVYS